MQFCIVCVPAPRFHHVSSTGKSMWIIKSILIHNSVDRSENKCGHRHTFFMNTRLNDVIVLEHKSNKRIYWLSFYVQCITIISALKILLAVDEKLKWLKETKIDIEVKKQQAERQGKKIKTHKSTTKFLPKRK